MLFLIQFQLLTRKIIKFLDLNNEFVNQITYLSMLQSVFNGFIATTFTCTEFNKTEMNVWDDKVSISYDF